ncbi:MAG: hypothetical protein AAGF85_04985 [Bacteroidota bacterium]
MALAALTIACLLFYMTSKYFPIENNEVITKQKWLIFSVASATAFLSLYIFTSSYGFATAFVIWLIAFMTFLSAIVLSVKMNIKWLWVWTGLALTLLVIDLS